MQSTNITVRGFHTDLFGHVNNARYLEFLESARWDWLSALTDLSFFKDNNMSFVVVSITINYRYPALLNDELKVSVELKTLGSRSIIVHQKVIRTADNTLMADADVTFVFLNTLTGKSIFLTEELKALLSKEN